MPSSRSQKEVRKAVSKERDTRTKKRHNSLAGFGTGEAGKTNVKVELLARRLENSAIRAAGKKKKK